MSRILSAEPSGNDFTVTFECNCFITFRGDYSHEVTAKGTCNAHAAMPPYSEVTLRMYDAARAKRDEVGMAYR